jgi:bacterial/archaeal transporter family protein
MLTESWLLWAFGAAAFAALMTIFAKIGLSGVDSDTAQLVRTAVVLPLIAALVATTGKWKEVPDWSGRVWLFLILSGLATGASWLCYFRALSTGDASRVAAIDKLSVVLVAAIATTMLHERLGPTAWCGIALVTAGLVTLSFAK